ncbi:MAG: hypothetical protein Q9219_003982 [cf. Caloplaca sp. 3 TL-2023]
MPPASPSSDQQNTTDDNSPLSDEDVGILYEIITCAEEDSNVQVHPFRSIFTAYDNVLARHKLDPGHDQIYLRFLLRLGEKRRSGETLYQSFESLLAELGIQIEINPEENEIQDVTRSIDTNAEHISETRSRSEAGNDASNRSRRASFHSLDNQKGGFIEAFRVRSASRESARAYRGNQPLQAKVRPSTRASTRPSERTSRRSLSAQNAAQPTRGRLSAREFASNLQHYQRRHASASISRDVQYNHGDLGQNSRVHPTRRPLVPPDASLVLADDDSGSTTNGNGLGRDEIHHLDARNEGDGQAYHIGHQEMFYKPTETQLLRDADTFDHFRLRALIRRVINRWHATALQAKNDRDRMIYTAHSHDLGTLLRQSFDQWRGHFQSRVEIAATERYFLQLENRAEQARDLYLLSKAFTHWQQTSREKKERARKARQQVLRVKYFHVWLDFTTQNQQKVRRQSEGKFYHLWYQHYCLSSQNEQMASFTRAQSLLKTGYWTWFWAFCARRAPQWKDKRLQKSIFNQWALASQRRVYLGYDVAMQRYALLKKQCFAKWLQQARSILRNSKQADRFCQQRIGSQYLLECRKMVRYAPLTRQVSNIVDWRIAGTIFASFVNRFRTEQQAKKVNQLRVIRNAWTAWNDHLRWQTLESQIDDRVLVQALYKWVLAERCLLLQRLCEQRLRHVCLHRLVIFYRARSSNQQAAVDDFRRRQQIRTSRLVINRWHSYTNICHQHSQMAIEFEAPRVRQQALLVLKVRFDHVYKLDSWAIDARYYFCALRFLKQWQVATVEAKRRKLHEAYAHIRRQSKMKLAHNCLQVWRDRSEKIVQMKEQAGSYDQNCLLELGTAMFDRWRSRYHSLADRQVQTVLEFDQRFAHNHLDQWISNYRIKLQLQELAKANANLRISNIAFGWLHKLHLRIIEIRGRENNAESLRRYYEKRRSHNVLRLWRDKTAKRLNRPVQPPVFSSARARRRQDAAVAEIPSNDAGERAEEWTAFDEGFDVGDWIPGLENVEASSTPLPGYLNTPSKRAARARGLVRGSSTTPAGTPFSARLRSQLGKGGARGELGKSGFGGSAFGAILESEPRTPGRPGPL